MLLSDAPFVNFSLFCRSISANRIFWSCSLYVFYAFVSFHIKITCAKCMAVHDICSVTRAS